ncbi:uncharacterized protein LOC119670195 [Teleopsis dalmanni]|uniref:uncharacterized protein LOC119670195 n=1 Tax=Teleopsis dalmanni TaxID=139649 RepID=UPI0018CFE8F7|nr:uncharacterized protein LOC119670195 [Teleopsis dalmanni]
MKCAVWNCYNYTRKSKQCSFFSFPKDRYLLRKWLNFCQSPKQFNENTWRMCSDHFQKEDIHVSIRYQMGLSRMQRLKYGAIPCFKKDFDLKAQKRLKRLQERNGEKIVTERLRYDDNVEIRFENESYQSNGVSNGIAFKTVIQMNESDTENEFDVEKIIEVSEAEAHEITEDNEFISDVEMLLNETESNANESNNVIQANKIESNILIQIRVVGQTDQFTQIDENEFGKVIPGSSDSEKIASINPIDPIKTELNQVGEIDEIQIKLWVPSDKVIEVDETELVELIQKNNIQANKVEIELVVENDKKTQVNLEDFQQNKHEVLTSKRLMKSLRNDFQMEFYKYFKLETEKPYKSSCPHFNSRLISTEHIVVQQSDDKSSQIQAEFSDVDVSENSSNSMIQSTTTSQPESDEMNYNSLNTSQMYLDKIDDSDESVDIINQILMQLDNNSDAISDIDLDPLYPLTV